MSLPKEPRQLMINLMYLVLTALLALNVSNEILHAFKVINQSIKKSNASIETKNNDLYDAISANEKMAGKYEKVHPYKVRADQVKKAADDMVAYLQELKKRIIMQSGGYDSKGEIKSESDIDASTYLMVDKKGGDTLKNKIGELRTFLLSKLDAKDTGVISSQMPLRVEQAEKTANNPQGDWSMTYFHAMPTMAAVTLLAKFQNDVRNSEALTVNKLFEEAHSTDLKFDAIQAIAVPKTSYALKGQKIEAQIMLAAYNKTIQPQVTASSGKVVSVQDGVANWEITAGGVGEQTVHGTVSLNMGDHTETKEYEFKYMVGSTGASLQLDKMNVFYIGVPNPVSVSAAGYSLEDVSLVVPGGKIEPGKEKGKYNIMMQTPGDITVKIMAKDKSSGGTKEVGSLPIRVKYIPDPVAEIANKNSGGVPANIFRVQKGIIANLKNFEFDARFVVTSFDFNMLPKHKDIIGPYTVKGPYLDATQQVRDAISRARPGDKVFIENIKAKGPDGKIRSLNSITLTLL